MLTLLNDLTLFCCYGLQYLWWMIIMAKGMVDDCIGLMVVYSVDRYFGIGSFVGTSYAYMSPLVS